LCESKDTAAALRSVAGGYLAPIAGVRGMANGFLRTQIAPLLDDSDVRHVLYLGDLDVSGEHIEANTRHVLERASECALLWSRIGITQAQVAELGITPIHKVDGRGKAKLAHLAYEVESLGQKRVIALVRDALEALLPEPLERVQGREDEQIAAARRLLAGGNAVTVPPDARAPIPRIALTRDEAAAALGMSLDSFERHVQPELRLIRRGKLRLVPVRELERWADGAAERTVAR
jgi:hypothetical protein